MSRVRERIHNMRGGGLRFTSSGRRNVGGCGCDSDVETEGIAVRQASNYFLLLLLFLRRVRGTTDFLFRQKRRVVISSVSLAFRGFLHVLYTTVCLLHAYCCCPSVLTVPTVHAMSTVPATVCLYCAHCACSMCLLYPLQCAYY